MSNEIVKWADQAMFEAAPMQANRDEDGNIFPKVHLLWMTPDPLGSIAAMARMYEGKPTYDLRDITDEERRDYLAQVQKTHLQAPLEAVKLHFFVEGVTRSWTHQAVRQRTAVYAQESLRFAVPEEPFVDITALPPSLAGTVPEAVLGDAGMHPPDQAQRWRLRWDACVDVIDQTYHDLVNDGMPAEDARGLIHHAITTRMNWVTDLRNLIGHAGNRLCTQAQFEWRIVFLNIVKAISEYEPPGTDPLHGAQSGETWQFQELAGSGIFRPVCYQLGHCPFNASFDRACTIRERVEAFAKNGVPSTSWGMDHERSGNPGFPARPDLHKIRTAEWLLDPTAARRTGGGGH